MDDKKKKRLKIVMIVVLSIVGFFLLYILTFKAARFYIVKNHGNEATMGINSGQINKEDYEKSRKIKEERERKKSLLLRLEESKKIYLNYGSTKNIKIAGESLNEFKNEFDAFVKVTEIGDKFDPKFSGRNDSGVNFETDCNYFKIYTDNRTEYYKIPVAMVSSYENLYKKLIFTSIDYIGNKDGLGKVMVYYKNDEKRIWPWKKSDLLRKIIYKREVGKIQPEKEFEKSKDSFSIKMEKDNMEITIQTMGKDFIKVTCGNNVAYYEVYKGLYDYMKGLFS